MAEQINDAIVDLALLRAAGTPDVRRQHLQDEVTQMFEEWRTPLLRYVSTFGMQQQDREEVVQEVFLALYSHLQNNKARTNLRAWLFRVAHNLALRRRQAEHPAAEATQAADQLQDPGLNPEESFVDAQRQQRLRRVFAALPEQDRRCLSLRSEGLRYREIAEVVGISLGSVALSLERSLLRLQRVQGR